jgi:hypothetical protein
MHLFNVHPPSRGKVHGVVGLEQTPPLRNPLAHQLPGLDAD